MSKKPPHPPDGGKSWLEKLALSKAEVLRIVDMFRVIGWGLVKTEISKLNFVLE